MPVLLLGNIFLLLCNENILFNRVKNIVFVSIIFITRLFNKGNRKHFFLCFYRVIEILVLVWENSK